MLPDGTEHPADSSGKTAISESSAANSGAVICQGGAFDADLQAVVDAWPMLTAKARAAIIELAKLDPDTSALTVD
jgi:hypothetical protein